MSQLKSAKHELATLKSFGKNLVVDDDNRRNIMEIKTWIRNLKKLNPDIGMFIVDYIGLVGETPGAGNRENKVAQVSRGLKQIANEHDIAVIALSQINRTDRENGIHELSDLRESGSIEQDADSVLFICPTQKDEAGKLVAGGKMWINVAKQREGSVALVPVNFTGWYTRFDEWQDGNAINPHNQQNVVDKDRDGPMF